MKNRFFVRFFLFSFFVTINLASAQSDNPFLDRRQQVLEKMSPKGLLILKTSQDGHRFGYGFQQESNLFYLTGITEADVILILSKPGIPSPGNKETVHSVLITDAPLALASDSEKRYQILQDSLGYDLVCGSLKLRKLLTSISEIDELYTNIITKRQQDTKTILEKRLIKLREKFPDLEISSTTELTQSFRQIKSADEIALIQKAIDITTLALKEAMKSMQPGLIEYQIEAVIEYVFKFNGSHQLAFPSIVGSGPNSLELHYDKGIRKIEGGDMVVMDIGCEHNHYCADITRTIPANGIFTPEQKEIYNIVLEANQTVIDMLRPGFTMTKMDSTVRAVFRKYGYEKYIRHGCTHHLGLDVHDVGARSQQFKSGMVITVEPGLYIPPNSDLAEAYWNIGIRIEDDVLITEDGHRVLSAACPKTVEEIETLMKLEGLGNISF